MGRTPPHATGLYDPRNEHDACGVGMVAHIKGAKSHAIVTQALEILANLDHRGAVGADGGGVARRRARARENTRLKQRDRRRQQQEQ